jgi:hypothetical protein
MARVCTDLFVSVSSASEGAYDNAEVVRNGPVSICTSRLVSTFTHHMGESAVQSRHWTSGLEGWGSACQGMGGERRSWLSVALEGKESKRKHKNTRYGPTPSRTGVLHM